MSADDTDYTNLETWLATFVTSGRFAKKLEQAVDEVENPAARAKLMLDLVDYIRPKFKTVDPPSANDAKEIHITYVLDDKK
jgi:hypothetical protein